MATPLSSLRIQENKIKQLNTRGITSVEDLLRFFPQKYIDYSHITALTPELPDDYNGAFCFYIQKIDQAYSNKGNMPYVRVYAKDVNTDAPISILFFNQRLAYPIFAYAIPGAMYFCAGTISHSPTNFIAYSMTNPVVFEQYNPSCLRLYPVYRKVKGMSDPYLIGCIKKALAMPCANTEPYDPAIVSDNGLLSLSQAYSEIHNPSSPDMIRKAHLRLIFDILLKFSIQLQHASAYRSKGSGFNLKDTALVDKAMQNLPFSLTEDQKKALDGILTNLKNGRRVNALVQGDVGSGKTILAFLSMFAMVGSGYQCALMAPSKVLAQQHYDALQVYAKELGIETALFSGTVTKKASKDLASGRIKIAVGTHSLLSKNVVFQNLALIIVDEEHKFGVAQREALLKKASVGIHCISMSATPIPRSLAQVVYGEEVELHTIRTMPAGRKPVITASTTKIKAAMQSVKRQLDLGHQAFVVCPMITASNSEKMDGVKSVEELEREYSAYFNPFGYQVVSLTGKDKKADLDQKLELFRSGQAHILIATTVVEVGVNIPNATIMIIHNAERFGLSSLHQLRGRVGRSSYQSYCALVSDQRGENERLKTIETSTDGFEIAKADLNLRGPGEWLGENQSGRSSLPAQLMIAYPEIYNAARKSATLLLKKNRNSKFVDDAIAEIEAEEAP